MDYLWYRILALFWTLAFVLSLNLQFDEFYSKSFVPNDIFVSYSVDQMESLSFNMTVKEHFPGKLLMHIFVRKLDNIRGGQNSFEMVKMKNLDFCKTLESLRNLTLDDLQGESLMPPTFLISCPLIPGFYFVERGSIDANIFPVHIHDGRYFVQFELIQVYEEVIKLVNCKIKFSTKSKETAPNSTDILYGFD